MTTDQVIRLLNQLLVLEYRSFAVYLVNASPWMSRPDSPISDTLNDIASDQRGYALRIAERIDDLGSAPDLGTFSMDFTDKNDLSIDYLVNELIVAQQRTIGLVRQIVQALAGDRLSRELAEEVLGSEQAHLEALVALAQPHSS